MIFASLVIEREPLRWDQLPGALAAWTQDAGIVAAAALLIWAIAWAIQRQHASAPRRWTITTVLFAVCGLGAFAFYGLFAALLLLQRSGRSGYSPAQLFCLTTAGALALLAASLQPLAAIVQRLKWRRIWALALLSIKEATRGRVLFVFGLLAIVFLFANYFVPYKPEDQIRNYVTLVYWSMAPLFLLIAALLGAFSIPTDVTRQTIHTIVTKPVERYEIVLGRFLGYALLLTVGLFALTAVSLVYVTRGITEQAARESYKARVPVFPDLLSFSGTADSTKGENVGREWDYRSYIRGQPPQQQGAGRVKQFAVFSFASVPSSLAQREDPVQFEFTFDIYRTTKPKPGEEGVLCTLTFASGNLSVDQVKQQVQEVEKERGRRLTKLGEKGLAEEEAVKAREQLQDELIREHGVYEVSGVPVVDYHTKSQKVPSSLFQAIERLQQSPDLQSERDTPAPALKVFVSVGEDRASSMQLVGMARHDLYLLSGELPFWQNFFKGMIGLWFTILLVLGVALACSTYLSGIISLLCTVFLFGAGLFVDYVRSVAEGQMEGAVKSATRLFYNLPSAAPLEQTPALSLGEGIDKAYLWLLHYILKLIPDVQRFNLTTYVTEGFDISWGRVVFLDTFLPLAGYLLPWAILAYYLINSREVANPT